MGPVPGGWLTGVPSIPVFTWLSNVGDSEATFIADGERLNCPSCGGSGHVDDSVQAKVPETLPEFLEWVADELVKRYKARGVRVERSLNPDYVTWTVSAFLPTSNTPARPDSRWRNRMWGGA